MSNHLAIATVTAALKKRVEAAIQGTGSQVKTGLPPSGESSDAAGAVNILLYQVSPNAAARNRDLPTRRADASQVRRAAVALDLYYLVSFHGPGISHQPQVLLGMVARTLHAEPVFDSAFVQSVATDDLAASDLALAPEPVRITPATLSLEETSRLWGMLPQGSFALSAVYTASVVLIEQEAVTSAPLPVRSSNAIEAPTPLPHPLPNTSVPTGYALPFQAPVIARVLSKESDAAAASDAPIVSGRLLALVGRDLVGEVTGVRFGGDATLYAPSSALAHEVTVALPSTLRAGPRSVQVVHQMTFGSSPELHDGGTSQAAVFVLRPAATFSRAGDGVKASAIAPALGASQRILLLLNETPAPIGRRGRSYAFAGSPSEGATEVTFATPGVEAGTYLARLQVDGAETLLTVTAETYAGPTLTWP